MLFKCINLHRMTTDNVIKGKKKYTLNTEKAKERKKSRH